MAQRWLKLILSRLLRDYDPLCRLVGLLVGRSALAFFGVNARFLHYCSCQIAQTAFFITLTLTVKFINNPANLEEAEF